MSLDLNKDIIEEIRSRCDIADLISSCGVQLKRSGPANFKGLCPFHQEKTPSFHVDISRQAFHCFGCGKGGDVFRFFMDKENVDFVNAAQILAARCGVIIPEKANNFSGTPKTPPGERERLVAVNEEFSRFFCRFLADNPNGAAAKYLAGRQIAPEIIQKFRIGAAPDSWTACRDYGRGLGFSDADMLLAGILRKKEDTGNVYDQFKGRVTFTIENEQGKAVGFSARTLEAKPADGRKYVNTPDTPVFHKGRLLYALPQARQGIGRAKMAVLCEGQLDSIAFHRAGLDFAVAPLGTAFTPEQARIIRRYSNNLILAFDADSAGRKAILRAAEILLPLSVNLKVLQIPDDKDPDELFATGGASALQSAVDNAVPWLEIIRETLPEKFDMQQPAGRSQAADFIAGYLKNVTSEVELEVYISQCAKMLEVSENAMRSALFAATSKPVYSSGSSRNPEAPKPTPVSKEFRDPARTPILVLFELALSSIDNGRRIAGMLEDISLPDNDPVNAALNITINAALNGEYESLDGDLQNMLIEHPSPEVSRAMLSRTKFTDPERALTEAYNELRRLRKKHELAILLEKLRTANDNDAKMEILSRIQKLNSTP